MSDDKDRDDKGRDKAEQLPADKPRRPGAHKPGTGEGEYPVHPDRPNAPEGGAKPDQGLPGAGEPPKPDQGLPSGPGGPGGPRPDNTLPETPEPKKR